MLVPSNLNHSLMIEMRAPTARQTQLLIYYRTMLSNENSSVPPKNVEPSNGSWNSGVQPHTNRHSFFFIVFRLYSLFAQSLTHEHAKTIRLATSSSPPPSSAQTKFHFITRVVRRALFTLQLSRSCNNVKGWLAPSQCISRCHDNNETKEGDQYHLRLHIYI